MEKSHLFDSGVMDSARVARIGYSALMKGKTTVIPGIRNKLLAQSVRIGPRKMVTSIVRNLQANRQK